MYNFRYYFEFKKVFYASKKNMMGSFTESLKCSENSTFIKARIGSSHENECLKNRLRNQNCNI